MKGRLPLLLWKYQQLLELQLLLLPAFLVFWTVNLAGAASFGCNELTSAVPPADVIKLPCDRVKGKTDDYDLTVGNIADNEWERFSSTVKQINKANVIIKSQSIKKLILPDLSLFEINQLIIEDNLNLEEIRIRASTFNIKYVTISGNPKLTSITFDAHTGGTNGRKIGSMAINSNEELTTLTLNVNGITSYGGLEDSQLDISNNPKLTTIDMKSVREIDIATDVIIEDNANLKAIAFEHLKAVKTQFGTLAIRKNDKLEKLELKVHNGIEVNGKLLVQANAAMTQIVLQAYSLNLGNIDIKENDELTQIELDSPSTFTCRYVSIEQNPKLVVFAANAWLVQANIYVLGNNKLPLNVLSALGQLKMKPGRQKQIQKAGDCSFHRKITDLSELGGCSNVIGNLEFAKGAQGSAGNTALISVSGNVELADVPRENLDFLSGTNVTGYVFTERCDFNTLFNFSLRVFPCGNTSPTGVVDCGTTTSGACSGGGGGGGGSTVDPGKGKPAPAGPKPITPAAVKGSSKYGGLGTISAADKKELCSGYAQGNLILGIALAVHALAIIMMIFLFIVSMVIYFAHFHFSSKGKKALKGKKKGSKEKAKPKEQQSQKGKDKKKGKEKHGKDGKKKGGGGGGKGGKHDGKGQKHPKKAKNSNAKSKTETTTTERKGNTIQSESG